MPFSFSRTVLDLSSENNAGEMGMEKKNGKSRAAAAGAFAPGKQRTAWRFWQCLQGGYACGAMPYPRTDGGKPGFYKIKSGRRDF